MDNKLNYNEIIKYMCMYYDITNEEIVNLLNTKENRYILLLLLKKHDCLNIQSIRRRCKLKERRNIKHRLQKAEEMLLFNSFFRKKYFKMENYIKKTLDINNNMWYYNIYVVNTRSTKNR